MRERDIERRLAAKAKKFGGRALKFTSPGFSGVPDRIVLLPGGKTIFVELKAPGQKPTVLQAAVHEMIRQTGHVVLVIDSTEGVDALFA